MENCPYTAFKDCPVHLIFPKPSWSLLNGSSTASFRSLNSARLSFFGFIPIMKDNKILCKCKCNSLMTIYFNLHENLTDIGVTHACVRTGNR